MLTPMGEHGRGTIRQEANGRWRVAVTMADGRRVFRRERTAEQAEETLRALVEARDLELEPRRLTLEGWLRSWIDGMATARNARVRPRTLEHYRLVAEEHIIPALGKLELRRVTAGRIQAWLDSGTSLRRDTDGNPVPLSNRTIHHHHAVLRRALNVAVKRRLIAYNPALAVELPEVDADKGDPLTAAECRAILEATRDDHLHALWRLAMVTGLRQGELLGLGWEHIDGDTIRVEAQLQRIGGQWVRSRTKAAHDRQVIAIDPETARVLEVHRRSQAADRKPDWPYWGHVFLTSEGNLYHGAEVLKAWKAACRKAGVRERRFHDIRHAAATIMRDLGVAEETRQSRMGHSTTSMSRRYAKASDTQDREAARRLAEAIG
jgi:integrase